MDIIILLVSIAALSVSVISLLTIMMMRSKMDKLNDNNGTEKKFDELRESVYNEFARNRNEQNQSALAQRQEMSAKISDVKKSLDLLSQTNQEQLIRIYRQMSEGMTAMRDKNAEIIEKQNEKIEKYASGEGTW